jgi:hypothetical protein
MRLARPGIHLDGAVHTDMDDGIGLPTAAQV